MVGELIAQIIVETLPKVLGASLRWCFFLGKKSFNTIFNEDWNKRVGILAIVIIIGLIIWFNN